MDLQAVIHMVIHGIEGVALAVAFANLRWLMGQPVPRKLATKVEAIELYVSDLEERHESLHKAYKRLNSRVAMRQAREKKAELDDETPVVASNDPKMQPGESVEAWKRRCRGLIRAGVVQHAT